MSLRCVIAHFRKQEWTAILLDFVIVVLGVFVGLQVQQWSLEHEREKQHARYYERLQADFKAINTRNKEHILVFSESIDSLEYVPKLIRLDTVADEQALSGIRRVPIDYDLEGMRSDPEFEIALEILEANTRSNLGVRQFEMQLVEEVLALLEKDTVN